MSIFQSLMLIIPTITASTDYSITG